MKIKSQNIKISLIMAVLAFLSIEIPQFIIAFEPLRDYLFEIAYSTLIFIGFSIILFLKFNNDSILTMIKRFALSSVLYIAIEFLFIMLQIYPNFVDSIGSVALTEGVGSVTDAGTMWIMLGCFSLVFPIIFIATYAFLKFLKRIFKFEISSPVNAKILNNNIVVTSVCAISYFAIFLLLICGIRYLPLLFFILVCALLATNNCKTMKDTLTRTGVLYLLKLIQIAIIYVMQIRYLGA